MASLSNFDSKLSLNHCKVPHCEEPPAAALLVIPLGCQPGLVGNGSTHTHSNFLFLTGIGRASERKVVQDRGCVCSKKFDVQAIPSQAVLSTYYCTPCTAKSSTLENTGRCSAAPKPRVLSTRIQMVSTTARFTCSPQTVSGLSASHTWPKTRKAPQNCSYSSQKQIQQFRFYAVVGTGSGRGRDDPRQADRNFGGKSQEKVLGEGDSLCGDEETHIAFRNAIYLYPDACTPHHQSAGPRALTHQESDSSGMLSPNLRNRAELAHQRMISHKITGIQSEDPEGCMIDVESGWYGGQPQPARQRISSSPGLQYAKGRSTGAKVGFECDPVEFDCDSDEHVKPQGPWYQSSTYRVTCFGKEERGRQPNTNKSAILLFASVWMGRKSKGTAPGRGSDFTGEKKEFLETFHGQLLDAGFGSGGDPGDVYTEVTDKFLRRYGYELAFNENVDGDPLENPPTEPQHEDLSAEEKQTRQKIRKTLRTVNGFELPKTPADEDQKISGWYRTRYRTKKVHGATIKTILSTMQSMSGPTARPRRKPALVVYSKLHYATRVKTEFDKVWAKVKGTVPDTFRVSMSQDFVRTCWEKESDSFKEDIEKQAQEMHHEAMEKWKAGRVTPVQSAESYHEALENLNDVGIPLADALAEHLGMHVVLMAVGPVGTAGGEVLLRSMFSDTALGATAKTWPQFDHAGFTAMEKSITRYGRAFFIRMSRTGMAAYRGGHAHGSRWIAHHQSATHHNDKRALTCHSADNPVPVSDSVDDPAPVTDSIDEPSPAKIGEPTSASASTSTTPPDSPSPPAAAGEGADGIEHSEWGQTLLGAHPYFIRKQWGTRWTGLVEAFVRFEWSWYHNEDRGRLDNRGRPPEFAQWMKEHRPWDDYTVSDDFGQELFGWWKILGPMRRWENVAPGGMAPRDIDDWGRLNVSGRSGVVLFVVGLAWWGQKLWNEGALAGLGGGEAALAAANDWQLLVDDMTWLLEGPLLRDRAGEEKEAGTAAEEGEKEKAQEPKKKAKKKGKKPVAPPARKAPAPTEPSATGKRKRVSDEETDKTDQPAEKRTQRRGGADVSGKEAPKERPKPRRLTRNGGQPALQVQPAMATNSQMEDRSSDDNSADATLRDSGTGRDAPSQSQGIGATRVPSSTSPKLPIPELLPPGNQNTEDRGCDVNTNGPSPDAEEGLDGTGPVDLDPFSGLSEEELAELRDDPDADEEMTLD
ncbi:hypothetical protein K438DRAFT_1770348 [Mycena galopus ATCC 62051]|nr:hypothetical protein K438DRAFT_1770348 [Mycena galopus ATCC 62051]